ncbi:hypothetical protein BTVI_76576 [Pitangus sulphuratus]|nr:hypothetical protein BTVI_76576 [Pitangus sulphuratus]
MSMSKQADSVQTSSGFSAVAEAGDIEQRRGDDMYRFFYAVNSKLDFPTVWKSYDSYQCLPLILLNITLANPGLCQPSFSDLYPSLPIAITLPGNTELVEKDFTLKCVSFQRSKLLQKRLLMTSLEQQDI